MGTKAAKRIKLEDDAIKKEMSASTAALVALAQASRERTAVAFFNLPQMRNSPEAALFMQAQARSTLTAVGLNKEGMEASTASVALSGSSTATVAGRERAALRTMGIEVVPGSTLGRGENTAAGPAVYDTMDEGDGGEEVAPAAPPRTESTITPPTKDMAAPRAEGTMEPPAEGAETPPTEGTATPPAERTAALMAEGSA